MKSDRRFGDQIRACRQVQGGCRARLRLLSDLMRHPKMDRDTLASWTAAFQALEAEATTLMANGLRQMVQPVLYRHLVRRSEPLFQEFGRFLSAVGLGVAASDVEEELPMEEPMQTVPIGEHRLPPLPYTYDALEPYIDEATMREHHLSHHRSYVDGLNQAERKMAEARRTGDFDLIKHWEREAAFHGAGHYLHTIFWNTMAPGGGGRPEGALLQRIERDFGAFETFKQHFSKAAEKVEGVGWAILVWAPRAQRMEILTAEKHQNLSQWDVIPLLPLDVWEHAYYLKHQNDRKAYIEAWWNVVNWPEVTRRFEVAQQVRWEPF